MGCRGGRPGLPVPNSPYGLCGRNATLNDTELRSCEIVEVAVLGSPSLIVLMVSVSGCKATLEEEEENRFVITKAQQICGRGCGPGLLFPNSPSGLCGVHGFMQQ